MTDEVPAGYTYAADNYCPPCLIEELIEDEMASPAARDMSVEWALDQIAGANGIDRDEEVSFDSGEFPKPIWADQIVIRDKCSRCGRRLGTA